jgi:hypothetical protein
LEIKEVIMGLLVKDQIIVPGPIVRMIPPAGVAAAVVVFTIPAAPIVGTKSVKIHRVNLYNNAAGTTQVLIGTGVGVGFVALLPALDSINALNDSYGPETALIQAESFVNITAYPVALLAATSIDIQLEVIICG